MKPIRKHWPRYSQLPVVGTILNINTLRQSLALDSHFGLLCPSSPGLSSNIIFHPPTTFCPTPKRIRIVYYWLQILRTLQTSQTCLPASRNRLRRPSTFLVPTCPTRQQRIRFNQGLLYLGKGRCPKACHRGINCACARYR